MIIGQANLILYHASYTKIEKVDLSHCRRINDFGKGFYLTTDRSQAEKFVSTSILKAGKKLKSGYVNVYTMKDFSGLQSHEFSTTDEEWLHCVCAYRKPKLFGSAVAKWDAYDSLAGKIANDDTMTTLAIYLQGGYGNIGSSEAIDMAIHVLKPQNLKDQICIRTEKALGKLEFHTAYEVALR
jgi:hypothetical protein